jgi:hypothetical protein
MRLERVTITGADDATRPHDLCALSDQFPFVEWGILFSERRQGKEPRYPSIGWIYDLLMRVHSSIQLSAHLCGQYARDAVSGPFLWALMRPDYLERFQRIQINGAEKTEQVVDRLAYYGRHFEDKKFILQVREFGRPYAVSEFEAERLFDRSGGRGIETTDLPDPDPVAHCGYAGGFGPDNLEGVLGSLSSLADHDRTFWVDMETKVRSDDCGMSVLDLGKVRRCLEIAAPFVD